MTDENPDFDLTDTPAPKGKKGSKASEMTALDRLREKLDYDIINPDVQLEVPKRPGVTLIISPNIGQVDLKKWRKQAGEGTKTDFDPNKFARIVIAQTTKGFVLDGKEVETDEGDPVTFTSDFVKEWLEATDPLVAVKKLYGLDPHLEAAAMAVLDAAGYGDEVSVVDPTKLS